MSGMEGLTNWTRFENGIGSEIGSNFSFTGTPTYEFVKYGGGMKLSLASNVKCYHSSYLTIVNNNRWTIEFDVLYKYNVTNGVYADEIADTGFLTIGNTLGTNLFYIIHRAGGLWISWYRADGSNFNLYLTTEVGSWLAGTVKQFRIVYDTAGINGGSDKLQLYLDGIKVWGYTGVVTWNIEIGGYVFNLGWQFATYPRQFQSPISNFKSWNYANTDLSSINNPKFGGAKRRIT